MVRGFATVLLGASLTASMPSCGGEFESDDDGVSGSTGSGGSSAGGSSSAGHGGAGNAGARPSGGMTGSSGSGSGGAPADSCALPAESGMCDAFFPSFFHNPETGVCEPFVYGGCGGNENRFDSVEDCQAACHGGSPNMDACVSPLECVLVSTQCCGPCDAGLESYTAVNVAALQDFQGAHACGNVACEPCPQPDPTTANRPYLTATCRNGACVPIDVRLEGTTECLTDGDCHLRGGVGCCESCAGEDAGLVALSNEVRLAELVCGDEFPPCLACEPVYPPGYAASCEVDRCILTYTP
jgi:hypothetical protein